MIIFIRDANDIVVENWPGLDEPADFWMDGEHQCLMIKTELDSIVVCSTYLRNENRQKSELYNNNVKLLNKIAEETAYIRGNLTDKIICWGDKNSYVGRTRMYCLPINPHKNLNKNKKLLIEHLTEQSMVMLNENTWKTSNGTNVV